MRKYYLIYDTNTDELIGRVLATDGENEATVLRVFRARVKVLNGGYPPGNRSGVEDTATVRATEVNEEVYLTAEVPHAIRYIS